MSQPTPDPLIATLTFYLDNTSPPPGRRKRKFSLPVLPVKKVDHKSNDPRHFKFEDDGSITVILNGFEGIVKLIFTLPTNQLKTETVLVGTMFEEQHRRSAGREMFPEINVTRHQKTSYVTITDTHLQQLDSKTYHYQLLVQQPTKGRLALIDPSIRNEP